MPKRFLMSMTIMRLRGCRKAWSSCVPKSCFSIVKINRIKHEVIDHFTSGLLLCNSSCLVNLDGIFTDRHWNWYDLVQCSSYLPQLHQTFQLCTHLQPVSHCYLHDLCLTLNFLESCFLLYTMAFNVVPIEVSQKFSSKIWLIAEEIIAADSLQIVDQWTHRILLEQW